MCQEPIKIHDYHCQVLNSREEFIKDFERKNGRKPGLKFFNYFSEKEKLDLYRKKKEEDMNYEKMMKEANLKVQEKLFSRTRENSMFHTQYNTSHFNFKIKPISPKETTNKVNLHNFSSMKSPSISRIENENNTFDKTDLSTDRKKPGKLVFRKKMFTSRLFSPNIANNTINNNNNKTYKEEHKGEIKNLKTHFKTLINFSLLGKANINDQNDKKYSKTKSNFHKTTNKAFMKKESIISNTSNKDNVKENNKTTTQFNYKPKIINDNESNTKIFGPKSKIISSIIPNEENLDIIAINPLVFDLHKGGQQEDEEYNERLFNNLKGLLEEELNRNPENNEEQKIGYIERIKGKNKNKRTINDPYEYFSKYKKIMSELNSNKEEDYKIIVNGKVYDKRDITNVSKEVLRLCNYKRDKIEYYKDKNKK